MSGLLLRRREMMFKAERQDYITDGLIFWLDGYDATNDSWTDKIGSRTFALHNCSVSNHGVVFNGSSSYGDCSTNNFAGATIEACIKRSNTSAWAVVFDQKSTTSEQNIVLSRSSGGTIYTRATDANVSQCVYAGQSNEIISAWQDGTKALVNGAQATIGTGNLRKTTTSNRLMIGLRVGSSTAYFNGTIYAIRVYNRKLTEAEMLHNQHIENSRFNLNIF